MSRRSVTSSLADDNAAPGGVAAVDRALSLLCAFQPGDRMLSLAELSQRTRLYKSTVLRLLASLEHSNLVQRVDRPLQSGWTLGSEVARLNSIYLASFSLESLVLPVLEKLVTQTGESAAFHVSQGNARLCLYRVDSPHPVRDHARAGDLLDAEHGTGARVLKAFGQPRDDGQISRRIRKYGYLALQGDRSTAVAGVSAPVFRLDGSLLGALTLTMPSERYDARHIAPVVASAEKLSSRV